MGFLYFIVHYTAHRLPPPPFAMFAADMHMGAAVSDHCCKKYPEECKKHKIMCNKIDAKYQDYLIKFNNLVGKMDGEWKTMHSTVTSTKEVCGKITVPKYNLNMVK